MDTRLLQRSTRKLTLTPSGAAFFEQCAPAVDGVLDAGKALRGGSQTAAGRVRVAAPADFLDLFRIEWVAKFLSQHPKVRLEFVLGDARADLIAEAIDVPFAAARFRNPKGVPTAVFAILRAGRESGVFEVARHAVDFPGFGSPRLSDRHGTPRSCHLDLARTGWLRGGEDQRPVQRQQRADSDEGLRVGGWAWRCCRVC